MQFVVSFFMSIFDVQLLQPPIILANSSIINEACLFAILAVCWIVCIFERSGRIRRVDFQGMLTRNVLSSRYLNGFEEYCTSTAITFRMDLPLKQGPKGEVKSEREAGGTAAASSSSEEQKPQADGEPCGGQSVVCKVLSLQYFLIKIFVLFSHVGYVSKH